MTLQIEEVRFNGINDNNVYLKKTEEAGYSSTTKYYRVELVITPVQDGEEFFNHVNYAFVYQVTKVGSDYNLKVENINFTDDCKEEISNFIKFEDSSYFDSANLSTNIYNWYESQNEGMDVPELTGWININSLFFMDNYNEETGKYYSNNVISSFYYQTSYDDQNATELVESINIKS